MIDLRSDTVTVPSPAMRDAIARAPVGDDVYGEDPTVHALEERVADMLGKEAALFVTSGTMGNQLALACLTERGDEVIVGEGAHIAFYESGAAPALSGVQFAVAGTGGFFTGADVEGAEKPRSYYCPRTSVVCLENTHNRAGGTIWPDALVLEVANAAKNLGLALHLDGARLWNASAASGRTPRELAAPFDTLSVCFSKGLGAPVGSAFVSTRARVERARRFRKMWGGGMRQSGLLAAAADHALTFHLPQLADDHAAAKALAMVLRDCPEVHVESPQTNIVLLSTEARADLIADQLKARGVLVSVFGPRVLRAVTHRDLSAAQIHEAATTIRACIQSTATKGSP